MKIIALEKPISGIIFDIDQTLYDNREYYNSQKHLLLEKLASVLNKSYNKTLNMLEDYQREYAENNEGREQSLGNCLLHFGIDFQQNISWRNELFKPENYLTYDKELNITLTILSNKCRITAVTNNPVEIGKRTLKALGVDEFFLTVVGIDTTGVSKPSIIPFRKAANAMHLQFRDILTVGDRMEVDLEIPVKEGMNGILIRNVEDIYKLPEILG